MKNSSLNQPYVIIYKVTSQSRSNKRFQHAVQYWAWENSM